MITIDAAKAYDPQWKDYVYNGLDTCVTLEVWEQISPLLSANDPDKAYIRRVYDFYQQVQPMALEMALRGIRIDPFALEAEKKACENDLEHLRELADKFAHAVWDKGLNPSSPPQVGRLLYDCMRVTEQKTNQGGTWRRTTNDEALRIIGMTSYDGQVFANIVKSYREIKKLLDVLSSQYHDRMFTSYNIVGTETGRWSSSIGAFEEGQNLQNITKRLRGIFIADEGKKLCQVDLKGAESVAVGFLAWITSGSRPYLDLVLDRDVHLDVARDIWPHLPWTGDDKKDRGIGEVKAYRHLTRRDQTKRLGHLSNYLGKALTAARTLKIPVSDAEFFQVVYFRKFPEIAQWQTDTINQLQLNGYLETPYGRRRWFHGKRTDDSTHREAIAYKPQSIVADNTVRGMLALYHSDLPLEILHNGYDSCLFQYREEDEAWLLPRALELFQTEVVDEVADKSVSIPVDAEVGWNWGPFNDDAKYGALNPGGLVSWRGPNSDRRTRPPLLHRRLR